MPRYAVKIGALRLLSDKPISTEERERALAELARAFKGIFLVTADGIEVVLDVRG